MRRGAQEAQRSAKRPAKKLCEALSGPWDTLKLHKRCEEAAKMRPKRHKEFRRESHEATKRSEEAAKSRHKTLCQKEAPKRCRVPRDVEAEEVPNSEALKRPQDAPAADQ